MLKNKVYNKDAGLYLNKNQLFKVNNESYALYTILKEEEISKKLVASDISRAKDALQAMLTCAIQQVDKFKSVKKLPMNTFAYKEMIKAVDNKDFLLFIEKCKQAALAQESEI